MAPETVVQHRARVGREAGHAAARAAPRAASPRSARRPSRPRRARPRASISVKAIGAVPGRVRDHPLFLERLRGLGQLAGEDADPGEHVERELELHERAAVTRELLVAGGQRMPGVGVPQLLRDRDGGRRRRTTASARRSAVACAASTRSSARRSDAAAARVPLRQRAVRTPRAAVSLAAASRAAGGARSAASRDAPHPGRAVAVARAHRGAERLEVRLARQADVRAARGVCAAPASSRAASPRAALVEGDLPMQHLDAGAPELVERPRCRPRRAVSARRPAHRHRAWRRPPRAARAARREGSGVSVAPRSQKRGSARRARREPAPGRPSARAPRRPARPGPSTPRRDATRGGPGRPADRSPPPGRGAPPGAPAPGRPVDRRAHQRMTEHHLLADRQQPIRRRRRPRPQNSMPSRSAARHTSSGSSDRLRCRHQQQQPGVLGSASSRCWKLSSMRPGTACAPLEPEPARHPRRRHRPRQLQDRQRVAARLGDEPVADALVQAPRDDRREQGARVLLGQARKRQLRQAGELALVGRVAHARTRSPPTRPAAVERRSRAPGPRPHRATGRHRRSTAAAARSATSASRLSAARATRKRSGAAPDARPKRDAQSALLGRWKRVERGRASARRADAAPRTAAPSRTRRRRAARPGSPPPAGRNSAAAPSCRHPPRRG